MATKYYRVLQDNFLWKAGAILSMADGLPGYNAIEDIWDATPVVNGEYITARNVEHPDNSAYFERVYPDTVTGKLFKTAKQLAEMYRGAFKSN